MNSDTDQTVIISTPSPADGAPSGEQFAPQRMPDRDSPRFGLTGVGWLLAIGGLALTFFGPAVLESTMAGTSLDRWQVDLLFWNQDMGGWPARAFCALTACFVILSVSPLFRMLGHPVFHESE